MNKVTLVATLGLAAVLILCIAVCNESRADTIPVPNGDFETLFKPGTTIEGNIGTTPDGGWSQGVGPDVPIDPGSPTGYEFDDGTTGDVADILGWIGADRDGWIANGGTYDRDETTGNLQGSVASQFNFTEGGIQSYLANGGDWGNPAGGLIVSDAPLAVVESNVTYTVSMMANGAANPVMLDLLADGVALTPSSSVDPVLSAEWQEYSRTYDLASLAGSIGKDVTIQLGVGREASGTQSRFDDVSLSSTSVTPPTGITIDGNFDDWLGLGVPVLIEDPVDMLDPNGDYRGIRVVSQGNVLYNMQTVNGDANGTASPTYPPDPPGTERYYYHLMIDADNDLSTGWDNSEYEGNPTGVTDPMGVDYYVQIGRHSDKPDDDFNDGIEVYFLWVDEAGEVHDVVIAEDFDWQQGGDSQELAVTFDTFGVPDPLPEDWPEDVPEDVLAMLAELFVPGQTMKFAAFQEGNADGWATDFTQTAEYTFADVIDPPLGDVNLDEEVNGLDVDPFVGLVTSGTYQAEGDMNGDGEVNGLDVDPFVAAVVGGVAAVPEPSALLLTLAALGILGAWRRKR